MAAFDDTTASVAAECRARGREPTVTASIAVALKSNGKVMPAGLGVSSRSAEASVSRKSCVLVSDYKFESAALTSRDQIHHSRQVLTVSAARREIQTYYPHDVY